MKTVLLGACGLPVLFTAGCTTELDEPYAPYYYPGASPPYTQRENPNAEVKKTAKSINAPGLDVKSMRVCATQDVAARQ